ncbi:Serine/threonine-protein kinase plo1 [Lachnellula cervina]|uniref:Serine/threonine-protein kinase plo1 n=1 Tax=Lachnellula cervina TaxID=1316786 RepID=A0A7D8YR69_9HELO|nr:Serine/threonine-protein kinase plo1 [Lachnellula cervina]
MEALSPRDANAPIRNKQAAQKLKAPASKPIQKEKDHPPPPPEEVQEPPSSDRKDGAVYRTSRLLGRGGFAICYEARLSGTKQTYALKIVKSHMPQKKMEQKIHSKMNHPNIVRFHRAFAYDKCTYLVLELCPNGSLMDMVKKRKFITEPEVRFWSVQMAGAIKYMHAKGIIHRDLKMGNIFLDKDMNVKVGDFGLAALFMSGKDWSSCRRTTLCGTPNYIAPEILSKDKQGHDHAVDIWSLGIIIFAMLTGKPPFQSTTADEIYRRAREREYDWPKLNTSENYISQETKDLVSDMLQAPEERPDPDTIVQHPFFTCGWMPQSNEMTPDLRERAPASEHFHSIGVRAGKSNLYLQNLKKLAAHCDVGPWNSPKSHTSTYREVAAEEKAGLTPAVPLPDGVVYRPFAEWVREQSQLVVDDEDDFEGSSVAPKAKPVEQLRLPASRPATQSYAAQQRARPGPSNLGQSVRTSRTRQPSGQSSKSAAESSSGPAINIPTRTKSRKDEERVSEEVADVEDRLADDLMNQLKKPVVEKKSKEVEIIDLTVEKPASIFSPREKLELLPNTRPDHVLKGLQRLQAELERALNSRSMALESRRTAPHPTIVVKWVDYTNKFGLGYILSNGSVGCIFRGTLVDLADGSKGSLPPSCIVVRDAERHLQNRGNPAYVDRHQIVPISGPKIEFYENGGEGGISRGKVSAQNYKITIKDGESGKLSRGVDDWDDRKREKIVLWKKFANYMTAFGRDQDYPYETLAIAPPEDQTEATVAGDVITFYQRWGDVGCWGFSDGHFQFNFPDHTKIVISADGVWCDFYHLPLQAAQDLSSNGTIPAQALDDRQHLSYPLQTLLNFLAKPTRSGKSTMRKRPEIDPMMQGIPSANDFRKKIEFIRDVVKEWVSKGGIGNSNMEPNGRLKWLGCRETVSVKVPYKHVWVTVGSRNNDDRRVAWFNPRKPEANIPDIVV